MKRIGKHTLYRGDCLKVMSKIPDHSVDMVLCDLPYGTTQNKWDSVLPFDKLWTQYMRVLSPSGVIVLTSAQPFTATLVSSNLSGFRYQWVWEKPKATGHLNAKKRPLVAHEDICVFYGKLYNPQKSEGTPYKGSGGASKLDNYGSFSASREGSVDGTRYPRSVLRFNHEPKPVHPTQKPVDLFAYLIRTYTHAGMTVLDNTMGSGTTGVACEQEGRKFIGIEQDTKYFQIAKKRIREARKRTKNGPPIQAVKKTPMKVK